MEKNAGIKRLDPQGQGKHKKEEEEGGTACCHISVHTREQSKTLRAIQLTIETIFKPPEGTNVLKTPCHPDATRGSECAFSGPQVGRK